MGLRIEEVRPFVDQFLSLPVEPSQLPDQLRLPGVEVLLCRFDGAGDERRIPADLQDPLDDVLLDLRGRDPAAGADGRPRLLVSLAEVVAVHAVAAVVRGMGHRRPAGAAADEAGQERTPLVPAVAALRPVADLVLHRVQVFWSTMASWTPS